MASNAHNPYFKPPNGFPQQRFRSISPPRAFIEPLSPSKPKPIEPNFNYPPLNPPADFTARPESSYAATPRARAYSSTHKSGRARTPSTIDALAEAALAASPSYPKHSRNSSVNFDLSSYNHGHPAQPKYPSSEPPHKRARSEHLPSPMVGIHPSRPATSYEASGFMHPSQGFNSRVEEAALLLNFQSGGWPNHSPPGVNVAPAPPRPHANSFPQDAFHGRPVEMLGQSQATLLPPFNPQDAHQPPPVLPSPPRPTYEVAPLPVVHEANGDVEMPDAYPPPETHPQASGPPPQIAAEQQDSQQESSENVSREASTAPKGRRGWPKGKPRTSAGAKKSNVEKPASKRASRKKTPDTRASRGKSEGRAAPEQEAQNARRKSLSDVPVFGERSREDEGPVAGLRSRSVPRETHMMIREASPAKAVRRKATVNPDTICAGCQTSRESNKTHSEFDEWISCNGCKKWYHVDCAGFKKAHDVRDVDKFFCTACEPEHGKTTYVRKSTRAHASVDYAELQKGVLKTSDESMEHHYIQPIKDGTFQFDPETFPRMRPEMVTREFFEKSGTFTEPICIPAEWNLRPWEKKRQEETVSAERMEPGASEDASEQLFPKDWEYDTVPDIGQDKLDMVMPEGLTVRQVCNLVGPETPIDVIDVKTQNSGVKWNLSKWADYYEESEEKEIRNVISLEVSQTKLGRLLQRPKVVRDIDLQDDVWPQEERDKGKWPKVQFYCLMSVADSYTDFHIDFGGSSVYYHILKGKKTFFFIPPKPKHLKAYEEWNDSPQQNYTFLPSITGECYRVDLSEGDTMLIPSGWIHAVWTPEDSLVIGGNFLNRLSYKNQFKVVEIEKANETPMKFRYPFFQKIMWYTAIKYMTDDPLPDAVKELFYEGKKFERTVPIWADFDEDIANNDSRPGAHNARFYSQAEMDGLPDLVNFIFRTVMLVAGRVEGVSADRMKRVNASIPKGHGEPLDVAKTFALWVAWKRGNEDPPAWAHPDAVLPSSKEEGPPKKLSERKLKELERKEAIAAWRVAPDRQSSRVMAKNAAVVAANATPSATATATSSHVSSTPTAHQQNHQDSSPYYQNLPYATSQPAHTASPAATMMSTMPPGQYLSTPKTSVLGPKRVACDACRKRRIRCKHKDMVMQTVPTTAAQANGVDPMFHQSQLAPELHDNITVTPPRPGFMSTVLDQTPYAQTNGDGSGYADADGGTLVPGTNSYVRENIPMAMNGVAMFGEAQKRGRSKACFECRKSKRRCIHDENGNVDPVKAAENPVPRGTVGTKKRSFGEPGAEDSSPGDSQVKKPKTSSPKEPPPPFQPYQQVQLPPQAQMQGQGLLKPHPMSRAQSRPKPSSSPAGGRQQMHPQIHPQLQPMPLAPEQEHVHHHQPQIDPNLFSMYTNYDEHGGYGGDVRPPATYPMPEQPHGLPAPSHGQYQLPSLEQIANEVLVDLNGGDVAEQDLKTQLLEFNRLAGGVAANGAPNGESLPMANGHANVNGEVKPDESVDSAVSLPPLEEVPVTNGTSIHDTPIQQQEQAEQQAALTNGGPAHEELAPARAHPSIESDTIAVQPPATSNDDTIAVARPAQPKIAELPLYQPPAALSKSPEASRQQPVTNGFSPSPNGPSPTGPSSTEQSGGKRKRGSMSATPGSVKKARVGSRERSLPPGDSGGGELGCEDKQSLELAKMLQAEDLGLRRRSK